MKGGSQSTKQEFDIIKKEQKNLFDMISKVMEKYAETKSEPTRDTIMILIFYVGIILFITSIVLGISAWILYGGEATTYVDCYDRYSNKILYQVCEEKVNTLEEPGTFLSGLSSALLLISSFMIAYSVCWKNIGVFD